MPNKRKKTAVDYPSVALWLLVVSLYSTFTILYSQNLQGVPSPFVQAAEGQNYFIVGACADNQIYGWGNANVGTDQPATVGCFDRNRQPISGATDLNSCRQLAC